MTDENSSAARRISRLAEPIHAMTYYTPEILRLGEDGYRGWWHAYFGYRPSPMGRVGAGAVTAAFYNFAPRMVERAVPGVWEVMEPEAIAARRLSLVDEALLRSLGDRIGSEELVLAANRTRQAIEGTTTAGRPVFGAYSDVDWPEEPHLALWHGCTLFRELRGDSHNIALAAAEVDGVQCHVLMAARGHGNMATILGIRGWNEDEWLAAIDSLAARGWISEDGELTEAGHQARTDIERHTDELSLEPVRHIGAEAAEALALSLSPVVDHLVDSGEVTLSWPPPDVMKSS